MAQRTRRKNEAWIIGLRATGVAAFTWLTLASMQVEPAWLAPVLAALAGVLMFAATDIGILVSLFTISVPVIAASPLAGIAMLVLGVTAVRYLAADRGGAYFVLAAVIAGAHFGPVWAAVALAGYLLGAAEGALAAAVACLTLELIGLALGRPGFGATLTGGTEAIVTFAGAPENLLSGEWVAAALAGIGAESANRLVSGVTQATHPLALFLQPALWAAAAALAGLARPGIRPRERRWVRITAVVGAVVVSALGSVAIFTVVGLPVPWRAWSWAVASSLAATGVVVVIAERIFPRLDKAPTQTVSMASEDADVDELLHLIATAEDKLTAHHASQRVVLITDMKSFSRMTEEEGSVATAKAIQRHRDLLLPLVSGRGGFGKSTGGDGLVAAFENAADALLAAVDMQVALAAYGAAHPNEREIGVRAGLASGEVVLDKGGRPFIGEGLNLAARIMNQADGGQILAAGDVAASARNAGVRVHYFGKIQLKNISKPVEIAEVLWSEDQQPRDPRDLQESAE